MAATRTAAILRKQALQGVFGQVRKHSCQVPAVGLGGPHCWDEGLDAVEVKGKPYPHEAAAETVAASNLLKERLLPPERRRKGALKVAGVAQAGKLEEFARGGADVLHEGHGEDDPLLLLRKVGHPLLTVGRLVPQYLPKGALHGRGGCGLRGGDMLVPCLVAEELHVVGRGTGDGADHGCGGRLDPVPAPELRENEGLERRVLNRTHG